MIFGIQLVGILFGLVMIYLTYSHYMRKRFTKEAFIMWSAVWVGTIFLFSVPKIFYGIMNALQIHRTADFFVSAALIFLTAMTYHMYVKVKSIEDKVEHMVRKIALERKNK